MGKVQRSTMATVGFGRGLDRKSKLESKQKTKKGHARFGRVNNTAYITNMKADATPNRSKALSSTQLIISQLQTTPNDRVKLYSYVGPAYIEFIALGKTPERYSSHKSNEYLNPLNDNDKQSIRRLYVKPPENAIKRNSYNILASSQLPNNKKRKRYPTQINVLRNNTRLINKNFLSSNKLAMAYGFSVSKKRRFELSHLIAHSICGNDFAQVPENLVLTTEACNTLMMVAEHYVKHYHALGFDISLDVQAILFPKTHVAQWIFYTIEGIQKTSDSSRGFKVTFEFDPLTHIAPPRDEIDACFKTCIDTSINAADTDKHMISKQGELILSDLNSKESLDQCVLQSKLESHISQVRSQTHRYCYDESESSQTQTNGADKFISPAPFEQNLKGFNKTRVLETVDDQEQASKRQRVSKSLTFTNASS